MTILDPLYGAIILPDFAKDILNTPELQRLSEIRLMNVCGPTMIGATSTTRLEHALGVAHLANVYSKKNKLRATERNNLILGCLIHDVACYPYGHLVENIFRRNFPGAPDHTLSLLENIYRRKEDLVIYRGAICSLYRRLFENQKVFGRNPILSAHLILGADVVTNSDDICYKDALNSGQVERLNRLISGSIDLDNIDNVFRIAQRFGIRFESSTPEKLAEAITFNRSVMRLRPEDLPFLKEWMRVRKQTYEIFLTHPDILAMKALLTYCVEQSIAEGLLKESDWILTDVQILEKLLSLSHIKQEARQILLGHELNCMSIFCCKKGNLKSFIDQLAKLRNEVAHELKIKDTRRKRTGPISDMETKFGGRRLFIVAEYDRGSTSRKFRIETIAPDGRTAENKDVGENSNRIIVSFLMPDWCSMESAHYKDICREKIASRLGCLPKDVEDYGRVTLPNDIRGIENQTLF